MKNSSIKLTIIIVHYKADQYLENCIDSINKEVRSSNVEIVIVDNGQSTIHKKITKKNKIIKNTRNNGYAKANNQGILAARGEYILLLNPDTKILKNSIKNCIKYLESHPQIGVLGCRLLNEDGSLQSSCRNFPSPVNVFIEAFAMHKIIKLIPYVKSIYLRTWKHDSVRKVDSVKGAFLLTKMDVFNKIGLLDESFFMYGEELDFCKRVKENGWNVTFYPKAEIVHYGGKSTEIHSLNNLIELHRAQKIYCKKHLSENAAALCLSLYWMGLIFRMMLCIPGIMAYNLKRNKTKKRFRQFYETAKSYFKE